MIPVQTHNRRERIGRLDQRITIQQYTTTRNEFGEEINTWEELQSVWSDVDYTDKNSDEQEDSNRLTAYTGIVFSVRYNVDFWDKKLRVLYQEKEYDINSVHILGRKQFLTLKSELKE